MYQNRTVGVTIPEGQRSLERGEPNTLTDLIPINFFAARWIDEYGRVHRGVIDECGGIWYLDPQGEAWAENIKQVAPWLKAAIEVLVNKTKASESTEPITNIDKVDVIGSPIPSEKL